MFEFRCSPNEIGYSQNVSNFFLDFTSLVGTENENRALGSKAAADFLSCTPLMGKEHTQGGGAHALSHTSCFI